MSWQPRKSWIQNVMTHQGHATGSAHGVLYVSPATESQQYLKEKKIQMRMHNQHP